jgi:transcriptional regulator with XRE-family HTH domain
MLPPDAPEITPGNAWAVQPEEKIRMPRRDNPEDLKFVVVFLRMLRGWTQAELAEAAGLSASAISRYEIGDIVPGREALEEIALAVGLPLRMLDRVLLWVAAARSAVASATDPGDLDRLADAVAGELAAGLSDLLDTVTAMVLASLPDLDTGPWRKSASPPQADDREEAPELWEALQRYEPSTRRVLVEESRRFQKWALCELLCAESVRAAACHSADEALELAELALLVAERTPGEESWRLRLQGYAWAHVGHARQARGDKSGAKEAFNHARPLWETGAPGDPGLLEARWELEIFNPSITSARQGHRRGPLYSRRSG